MEEQQASKVHSELYRGDWLTEKMGRKLVAFLQQRSKVTAGGERFPLKYSNIIVFSPLIDSLHV